MKNSLVCFFFILSVNLGFAQDEVRTKNIEIQPESSISVYGDAKIRDFTCSFDLDHLQAPATVSFTKGTSQFTFEDAELVLNNRGFDCGNKSRNEDFHEMVKTEEYPQMKLNLKEFTLKEDNNASATVNMRIAGKEHSYTVPVEIVEDEVQRFRGEFEINIRDFDLEPIKKMFGLIRIQDIIEINFDLRIKY